MNYSLYKTLRIDRPNQGGRCPLYLRYTYDRKYYNIPTELTLSPDDWNLEYNEFQPQFTGLNNFTLLISKKEIEIRKIIEDFKVLNDRYPSHLELKDKLQSVTPQRKTLKNYFDEFVEYKTEKKVEKSTLTVYKSTWKKWEEFQKKENKTFELKDISFTTLDRFISYFEGLGRQNNTIGKYIKTFKTFLHYLETNHKLTISSDLKNVKKPTNQSSFEVFSQKELETLKSSVFTSYFEDNNKHRDYELTEYEIVVGQMMMFLCLTGLSFIDFQKVNVNDIIFEKGDYGDQERCHIDLTRTKLKKQELCVIPIMDNTIDLILFRLGYIFLREIPLVTLEQKITTLKSWLQSLEEKESLRQRCDYPRLFPKITNQGFNKIIKSVCKKLKMNDPVKVTVKRRNQIIETTVPKYKRIVTHTGRRTFITQSLEQGIRLDVLMKSTGHKKYDTINRYTKITSKTVNSEFLEKIKLRPEIENFD